jgi:hypothetical protein
VTTGQPSEDRTITEVGRELLKYLHRRISELGTNQAGYRQARIELLEQIEVNRPRRTFNWAFEAVFAREVRALEEMGLIAVKYGSGALLTGRSGPGQIYNLSLTDDGMETAHVIVERESRTRTETAKMSKVGEVEEDDDTEIAGPQDLDLPESRFSRKDKPDPDAT